MPLTKIFCPRRYGRFSQNLFASLIIKNKLRIIRSDWSRKVIASKVFPLAQKMSHKQNMKVCYVKDNDDSDKKSKNVS